ncbi:tetratricopeptide repeat protein, partial [Streptomyces cyaneofuscatus]|uniref:caspase, EACC1-associated type n=1 Tax=Streptomyces cyaneofuscatus TaxID=66883 RepID=UPI0036587A9C
MKLPEPDVSRAVLIGAYKYAHLRDLPGVKGNIEALQEYLTSADGWGLPVGHCLARPQPNDPSTLSDELYDAAEAATDTLLIYYAGHGERGRGSDASELLLALPGARNDRPGQWLRYADVREAVRRSRAKRRIVILDCCYAGRAIDGGMSADNDGQDSQVAGKRLVALADMDGAVVLTAASGVEEAMCPPGWPFSAFTGALINLLREGVTGPVPNHPEGREGEELQVLDMTTVYACLREHLTGKDVNGHPLSEPQLGTRNQGGVIGLGPNPAYTGPSQPTVSAPSTLFAPDPVFIGRDDDLARLENAADSVLAEGGGPVTWLVHGMGGVGKSALIEQAAARLKDRFPDGRIEINLNGFESETDTDGTLRRAEPVSPERALERLLSIIQHPKIPADLAQRADEWRGWLSGKRVLLVLDNAAEAATIAPLVPGADAQCLVLVSSRNQDFPVPPGNRIALGGLDEDTAVNLLRATGDSPAEATPESLAELARRCCYLPVTLRPIGAALRVSPVATVLAAMDDNVLGEFPLVETAVRGAFQVSYDSLPADLSDILHHCAWHPGRTYSGESIAAMLNLPAERTAIRLGRLVDIHLLQRTQDAVTFHDLYLPLTTAAAEANAPTTRHTARRRLFEHLLTHLAAALLPLFGEDPERVASAGTIRFDDPQAALTWLRSRSAEVEAVTIAALDDGWEHAGQLTADCGRWLRYDNRYELAAEVFQRALDVAHATGNRLQQAEALTGLADSHRMQDEYGEAIEVYQRALDLANTTGNHLQQAEALTGLAECLMVQDEYGEAAEMCQRALDLANTTGNHRQQADALTGIGQCHLLHHEFGEAAEVYQQVLDLASTTGNRLQQAAALTGIGQCHLLQREFGEAAEVYQQVLDLANTTGNHRQQAAALTGNGQCHQMQDEFGEAAEMYQRALDLAHATGDRLQQAGALIGIGECHQAQDRFVEAAEMYQRALDLAHATGDRLQQAGALIGIGE